MPLDKNKLVAEATKHVQKAQWDKAIRVYEKILAEDPRDVRVLLKIGELQQKKGDFPGAAETLHRVAEGYSAQGFFLKAVAVYKQVVKLAPGDLRVHEQLAGLYQQLGIVSDATAQLHLVAAHAEKAGDDKKLAEVLGRMLELDPDNPDASGKLGELHARAGATALALEHLRRAAEGFKRAARGDDYLRVVERVTALDPANQELARELANVYLGRGDTKRALAKLQLCFKADPTDVETLGLLATAFRDLGQIAKTVSVYKELARIEADAGRAARARAAWLRVAELVPDDPDAVEALGGAAGQAAATAHPRSEAPAAAPTVRAAVQPSQPVPEAVTKLLQETEVFAKYGLYRKALEHLEKVFAANPRHLDARERARDLSAAAGDAAAAAEHGGRAVELAIEAGELARAAAALDRLRQAAPADQRVARLEAALRAAEPQPATESARPEDDADAVLTLELSPDDGELDEVSISYGPVEPDAELAVGDEVGDGGTGDSQPFEPIADEDLVAGAVLAGASATPEPDLQAEIDEVEFYVQQGLMDEARDVVESLLALYPDHPALAQLQTSLKERGERMAASPAAAAGLDVAPPSAEDVQNAAREVYEHFRRSVATPATVEDGDTHYDLGIAYREMGMVDEAIREFEVASTGPAPRHLADCLTMIGLCRLDKGDPAAAVDAYQRALRAGPLGAEASRALQYELARAYQALGDGEGALWYLQKVLRADPRYRDARALASQLGGGPGRPPPGDPDATPEQRRPASKIGYV